jgi:hypothetical protein
VISEPASPLAAAFRDMAAKVAARISVLNVQPAFAGSSPIANVPTRDQASA